MYRRLVILSVVVVAAVGGLGGLGYHAVAKWAQGLEGARLGEFAEVAEQIRQDVKRKLDEFIQAEQQRKYTDYLYYYVPDNMANTQQSQQQLPVLRSPLGDQWSNGYAYGYFQIEADGSIVTPYSPGGPSLTNQSHMAVDEVQRHVMNIEGNVLPSITRRPGVLRLPDVQALQENKAEAPSPAFLRDTKLPDGDTPQEIKGARSRAYPIESLQKEAQESQVVTQQRLFIASNSALAVPSSQAPPQTQSGPAQPDGFGETRQAARAPAPWGRVVQTAPLAPEQTRAAALPPQDQRDLPVVSPVEADVRQGEDLSEMVQIRIEPFVPLVVPGANSETSILGGQVFLLRHVQIEDRHLLQGFQLDEHRLVTEVEESAQRFMRDGMGFELPQVSRASRARFEGGTPSTQRGQDARDTAYTAILDFGFGDLILSLKELDPAWITKRSGELHRIYFAILATVMAAVTLALVSLWHNVRAQVKLATKKDDFISAVSHELRTPLTSIRMYAEMLEKNWVKSPEKLGEYYRNMRQESERLSRLVENVLDFARLQKGRKRYTFRLGNLNDCVAEVVAMMKPYAEQRGFTIRTDFDPLGQTPFDKDAVTQIVVNLIDNAVKYAACATDKTIAIHTRRQNGFTIIEVEDHGPGVPHRQRKKIFEEFYRFDTPIGADPRVCPRPQGQPQGPTPTTGTGLGLTLVKRFAEAHGGYVEIDAAQPTGAIFRVTLVTQLPSAS